MDLISRQAAIREIARFKGYIDADMIFRIQTGLAKLPPEQPEQRWTPCNECERRCNKWDHLKT